MASALVSESRGPGSRPGTDIFLCPWLRHSYRTSLHSGVPMGTGEFNAEGKPCNRPASYIPREE